MKTYERNISQQTGQELINIHPITFHHVENRSIYKPTDVGISRKPISYRCSISIRYIERVSTGTVYSKYDTISASVALSMNYFAQYRLVTQILLLAGQYNVQY